MQGKLKRFWASWKRLAEKIGTFQARVLLTVLYATVVLPFGISTTFFSDRLRIKVPPTEWLPCADTVPDLESSRKQ